MQAKQRRRDARQNAVRPPNSQARREEQECCCSSRAVELAPARRLFRSSHGCDADSLAPRSPRHLSSPQAVFRASFCFWHRAIAPIHDDPFLAALPPTKSLSSFSSFSSSLPSANRHTASSITLTQSALHSASLDRALLHSWSSLFSRGSRHALLVASGRRKWSPTSLRPTSALSCPSCSTTNHFYCLLQIT